MAILNSLPGGHLGRSCTGFSSGLEEEISDLSPFGYEALVPVSLWSANDLSAALTSFPTASAGVREVVIAVLGLFGGVVGCVILIPDHGPLLSLAYAPIILIGARVN
ncbi:MAG: hypothetical protein GEU79_13820 [Acidimicrobiia bacterium]|nr:hypothetical protein [Acidimicrobiia bacterium]